MKTIDEPRYFLCRDYDGKSEILFGDYPEGRWQSISSGSGNLEESKLSWGLHNSPCVECGQIFGTNYCEPYKTILKQDSICFGCNHWRDMLKHNGNPNQVVVDHRHFLICPDDDGDSKFKGFGGSLFKIKFCDGRKAETRNLWCQGDIPEHFKDRLKNNAEFIN